MLSILPFQKIHSRSRIFVKFYHPVLQREHISCRQILYQMSQVHPENIRRIVKP